MSIAERVASERGEELGKSIGYQVSAALIHSYKVQRVVQWNPGLMIFGIMIFLV